MAAYRRTEGKLFSVTISIFCEGVNEDPGCRTRWPCGLRRASAAASLLGIAGSNPSDFRNDADGICYICASMYAVYPNKSMLVKKKSR